ncbi:hypothetical protein NEOKW01_1688 [Nematocida sp. AWRm80]|nr:hypothetical protein NEOKW01_1688 [Nematocida sp. AWRm80]
MNTLKNIYRTLHTTHTHINASLRYLTNTILNNTLRNQILPSEHPPNIPIRTTKIIGEISTDNRNPTDNRDKNDVIRNNKGNKSIESGKISRLDRRIKYINKTKIAVSRVFRTVHRELRIQTPFLKYLKHLNSEKESLQYKDSFEEVYAKYRVLFLSGCKYLKLPTQTPPIPFSPAKYKGLSYQAYCIECKKSISIKRIRAHTNSNAHKTIPPKYLYLTQGYIQRILKKYSWYLEQTKYTVQKILDQHKKSKSFWKEEYLSELKNKKETKSQRKQDICGLCGYSSQVPTQFQNHFSKDKHIQKLALLGITNPNAYSEYQGMTSVLQMALRRNIPDTAILNYKHTYTY